MIINLTQHKPTQEQIEAGVIEPNEIKSNIQTLLTFDEIPTKEEIEDRAFRLARIAYEEGADKALIGGAPYLMSALENELKKLKIQPLYAFSKRVVEEVTTENGTEKKVFFKHEGFIEI